MSNDDYSDENVSWTNGDDTEDERTFNPDEHPPVDIDAEALAESIERVQDPHTITYGDRMSFLEEMAIVAEHKDALDEMTLDGTFRLKHVPLGRQGLKQMEWHGLIAQAENQMGAVVDWTFTRSGHRAYNMTETFPPLALTREQFYCFERHADFFAEDLPRDTEVSFTASQFDMNGSWVAALNRHGFIQRSEQRPGRADVWEVTEQTTMLQSFVFGDEGAPGQTIDSRSGGGHGDVAAPTPGVSDD